MKKLHVLLLAAVCCLLASCLELKSTIIVSKEGSATIEETALISQQFTALMQMGGGGAGKQMQELVLDRAKAEERAKMLGEGVSVKSHEEVKTADGKSGVKIVYAVADISKLKYIPAASAPKKNKSTPAKTPISFALNGSTLTITNPDAGKKMGGDGEKMKPSAKNLEDLKLKLALAKPMMAGLRMTAEVKGANGIASSNASHLSDGTICFVDIEFDKLADNTDAIVGVIESFEGGGSTADLAKKFEKMDGLKIEGQEVVTAELK